MCHKHRALEGMLSGVMAQGDRYLSMHLYSHIKVDSKFSLVE